MCRPPSVTSPSRAARLSESRRRQTIPAATCGAREPRRLPLGAYTRRARSSSSVITTDSLGVSGNDEGYSVPSTSQATPRDRRDWSGASPHADGRTQPPHTTVGGDVSSRSHSRLLGRSSIPQPRRQPLARAPASPWTPPPGAAPAKRSDDFPTHPAHTADGRPKDCSSRSSAPTARRCSTRPTSAAACMSTCLTSRSARAVRFTSPATRTLQTTRSRRGPFRRSRAASRQTCLTGSSRSSRPRPARSWSSPPTSAASTTTRFEGLAVSGLDGSIYVAGQTSSPDFQRPRTPLRRTLRRRRPGLQPRRLRHAPQPGRRAGRLSTFLGGSSYERATGVAVDAQGHATGRRLHASRLPNDGRAFQTTRSTPAHPWDDQEAFVTKLNARPARASLLDLVRRQRLRHAPTPSSRREGNACVAGQTNSTDLPAPPRLANYFRRRVLRRLLLQTKRGRRGRPIRHLPRRLRVGRDPGRRARRGRRRIPRRHDLLLRLHGDARSVPDQQARQQRQLPHEARAQCRGLHRDGPCDEPARQRSRRC